MTDDFFDTDNEQEVDAVAVESTPIYGSQEWNEYKENNNTKI